MFLRFDPGCFTSNFFNIPSCVVVSVELGPSTEKKQVEDEPRNSLSLGFTLVTGALEIYTEV